VVLFMQDPVQVSRLGNLLRYYRIFIDITLLFLLAWGLPRLMPRLVGRPGISPRFTNAAAIVLLAFFAFVPIFSPPGNVYTDPVIEVNVKAQLPPKPLLIAHRGASMLAPENTLASAEKAASLGVYGLETDVRISRDGVLFLMHDDTLARTTNVAAVFPGRAKENASDFTFSELRQLSAGDWFVKNDPAGTIAAGLVSQAEIERYRAEQIPTLVEFLDVVRENGLAFAYFDLYAPPKDHPYYSKFFDICLQQIKAAGIDNQVWIQVSGEQLNQVRAAAPEMKLAAPINPDHPPSPADLVNQGYTAVNSEYSLSPAAIQAYRGAGLVVNLWTVDEPWMFSQLWLQGASSITTNNSHVLAPLSQPVLALPAVTYRTIWFILGLLAMGLLVMGLLRFWGPEPKIVHDDEKSQA